MLSWKDSFVKPSGSLIFLSALSGPPNTNARGRLLLMLFSGEIYFSASCQREDFLTRNLLKPRPRAQWVTAPRSMLSRREVCRSVRPGEQQGAWQSISPWGNSAQTLLSLWVSLARTSLPSLSFSSPVTAVSPHAFLSPGPPAGLESGGVSSQ